MKVNYRTHPILEKLQEGNSTSIAYLDDDKDFANNELIQVGKKWGSLATKFRSNINIISDSFYDASCKAGEKLLNLFDDILDNSESDFHISGTYILHHWVLMIDFHLSGGIDTSILYLFHKNGLILAFESQTPEQGICWVTNRFNYSEEDKVAFIKQQLQFVVLVYMFKNYAQVETKILEPHSRIRDIGCKYINETNLPITYLDSKWFTTLIKSDEFKVRGHFRLQPKKKDGKWTHELIYIEDFMKTGYTAPARKLNVS